MAQSKETQRVLIIDDSREARLIMGSLLKDAGYGVYELETPIGATRLIIREQIDLVVIDINMPAMQGDKLAQLFRANPRFTHLRLILVSGESGAALERLGTAARADAWLSKSGVRMDLVNQVGRLLASA